MTSNSDGFCFSYTIDFHEVSIRRITGEFIPGAIEAQNKLFRLPMKLVVFPVVRHPFLNHQFVKSAQTS